MQGRVRAADRSRGESGAAAVETALLLTVVVIPLMFAMIGYGYMFSFREALSQAVTEGARAAVGATTRDDAQSAATAAVGRSLGQYGLTCQSGNLVRGATATAAAKTVGTCTAAMTPNCVPSSGLLNVTVGTTTTACEMTVTVTHQYRDNPMIPSFPLLGIVLPDTLRFTSVVTVG